jgi:hypothetical protein
MKSMFVKSSHVVKSTEAFPRFGITKTLAQLFASSKRRFETPTRALLFDLASHRCAGFININNKKRR